MRPCCSARWCCALLALLCCGALYAEPPTLAYQVVARYPHDGDNFTQGLELIDGTLYESSGLYGRSFIAQQPFPATATPPDIPPESRSKNSAHKLTERHELPARYFGEGLTLWGERLYVVTWREQRGLIFDRHSLQPLGEFAINGEGWGLTHNDQQLILSNGSAVLQFIDPQSISPQSLSPQNVALVKSLPVSVDGTPVERLNELEWIDSRALGPARVLANIWQTDTIVVIDPSNGRVTAQLDLSQLYPHGQRSQHADVLNGIAFDARDNTLLITGKFWPTLYRIRLLQPLP